MLGGRVPGIISVQSSGEPGSNMSEFWIRGIGTFGASSSALVLIDGLEGDLNSIDPADIESFSVLKDASATAVYGVRGANGVVLVTTKHGTSDKMEVNVRANVKISYLTKLPEYLRAYDYAVLANEASAMRGAQPIYDDIELKAIQYHLDPDFYPDVNWQDEILKRTSLQQTYYASARGGGSIARYFVSMNMSNESAIYKQDENSKYIKDVHYNTYGMRLNVDFNLTKTTELYFGSDILTSTTRARSINRPIMGCPSQTDSAHYSCPLFYRRTAHLQIGRKRCVLTLCHVELYRFEKHQYLLWYLYNTLTARFQFSTEKSGS